MQYEQLKQEAVGQWRRFNRSDRNRVLIGSASCGRAAGALEVLEAFRNELKKQGIADQTDIVEVGCLGLCYAEVLVEIQAVNLPPILYQQVQPRQVASLVQSHIVGGEPVSKQAMAVMNGQAINGMPRFEQMPVIEHQTRIVLRNCGRIDPTDIQHYIAVGGYSGLAKALTMTSEEVIVEMTESGLRGRGGAGFPTGKKWQFARQSPGDEKYVICNADEGDPGAFMDRAVLEGDPHAVLEGLVIAGRAIGATGGYIYARAEYPLAIERLENAIRQARRCGLLGDDILGSGFNFDVKIKKGAGAFVCGEETSLMASIEGKRGMPMPRPPFPAQSGLFGKPTNINNVETLASVSAIMEKGAEWYQQYGTEKSRGTKTFALAGKIRNTGLIEVPLGIRLGTIIDQIGGGVPNGKRLKAVQTGGPSGGCIPADKLDIPVDYEHLAEVGSIMGSGGMIVMDEDACMVDVAKYFLSFTEQESCGKCIPCRMGTQHLLRILTDITEGRGTDQDIQTLNKLCDTVKNGSLCGLGQTAPNPVMTTLRYFREEYERHVRDHKCDAGVCRNLITFEIDPELCLGCMLCAGHCPVDAIKGEKGSPHVIVQENCIRCGSCRDVCRSNAVLVK